MIWPLTTPGWMEEVNDSAAVGLVLAQARALQRTRHRLVLQLNSQVGRAADAIQAREALRNATDASRALQGDC